LAQVAQVQTAFLHPYRAEGVQGILPFFPQLHRQVVVVVLLLIQAAQDRVWASVVVLGVAVELPMTLLVLVAQETRQT
jgi:hypothetical protein